MWVKRDSVPHRAAGWTATSAIVAVLFGLVPSASAGGSTSADKVEFSRDIRPILAEACFNCHGPDAATREADLRLDRAADATADRGGYQAIVPGQPDKSEVVRRILSDDPDERMPPADAKKQLTTEQRELLHRWIAEGAGYDEHWSLVTPQRPEPPAVEAAEREIHNAIDAFIAARLAREGLRMSPEAGRAALVRRVTLDLTGLPPTLAELNAALADASPDWYERVVDRLLASPRYGERMAVEWLDAARYADTHGFHIDSHRDMWRWRDWVIEALNDNMPFDQFTIEQLAGDLLPEATLDQRLASGFNRNHPINFEGGAIPEEYLNAYIVDRVNTLGTVWLGLTIGCGQCHDHKYDPFTQRDYYQLYAFFHNVPEQGLDGKDGNAVPLMKAPTAQQQERLAELQAQIGMLEEQSRARRQAAAGQLAVWQEQVRAGHAVPLAFEADLATLVASVHVFQIIALPAGERTEEQQRAVEEFYFAAVDEPAQSLGRRLNEAQQQLAALEKTIPTSMVMQELAKPRATFMLERGQYDKPGEPVSAGVPAALPPLPAGSPSNRLGLARWLVDPAHPLTARVIVNRYWQMYFGTGLVRTAEDFGSRGELPSHPELLDWLATEFIRSGWDVKAMQRLIVTSATYRQSSVATAELYQRDPENRLLARGPRLRLPAEMIRDNALCISGLLCEQIGGPSVLPYHPAGLWEEMAHVGDSKFTAQRYVQGHGEDLYRRTMYTFWKRTVPPPSLSTFDAPDREFCLVRRSRTNTPLQALVLMNDPTYVEAARKFAERVMTAAATPDARIATAFRLATAREPSDAERAALLSLLDKRLTAFQRDAAAAEKLLAVGESPRNKELPDAELAAWTTVASVILSLDETLTKQ